MKLIAGLGNPGPKYAKHRHNIGFMVLDELASSQKAAWKKWSKGSSGEIIDSLASDDGSKVILLKPLTYMNNSGECVAEVASFYKISPQDICVVHDELDLEFGQVRLKIGGGPGGHNGIKSLIQMLASPDFARIRMGVGRPPHPGMDPADFVLSSFSPSEISAVSDMVIRALQGIGAFIEGPKSFLQAMNTFNQRK